jgi:signal transduction histidine kinase
MERGIARCDGIINELIDYTRARDLKCRAIAIDSWLGELLTELSPPQDVAVVRDFKASGYRLKFDPDRMRHVVVNLMENATHALAQFEGERKITIATRVTQRVYELTIADSGPGIAADVLAKVFEPLFSTKSFGTGLSLPLVKQITEQHGGSVHVESAPMRGTKVVIRLGDCPTCVEIAA